MAVVPVVYGVPGPAEPPRLTSLGTPKFAWLKAFDASARICSRKRSGDNENVLLPERVTTLSPGPYSEFRLTLPNVPFAGWRNAPGLNQLAMLRFAGLGLTPGFQ